MNPDADGQQVQFAFQLAFDYGQISHSDSLNQAKFQNIDPAGTETGPPNPTWPSRPDPWSNYKPGFEVRSYRLCHRVLLYHQFHDQNNGQPFLTQSLHFDYTQSKTGLSQLTAIRETGHRLQPDGTYWEQSIPPQTRLYPLRY